MKALLAQFSYETNTFAPDGVTAQGLFVDGGVWCVGEKACRRWMAEAPGRMTGSLTVLESEGCEVHPVFAASNGCPAGRLDGAEYQKVRAVTKRQIEDALPADLIVLHLHGASAAVGTDDIEGDLLTMLRRELGFAGRLVVSLDLHGNVTHRMLRHADVITAFRTYPHVDFHQTGERAARLALQTEGATTVAAKVRMLLPPTATHDEWGHFAHMVKLARQAECDPDVDDVALLPVQPWLDVEELGSCVLVSGRGGAPARVAHKLAQTWYDARDRYEGGLMPTDEILCKLHQKRPEPWVLVDTADATTGGSTGRSTFILELLLPHADSFAAPVLLQVVDPEAVDRAEAGETRFSLGDGQVAFEAQSVRISEGRGTIRAPGYRGSHFSLGGAAVLKRGELHLVVTRQSANATIDPAFYECVGLEPNRALAVQVKSLTGWMAGYGGDRSRGLFVDGTGATSLHFASLPFRDANRHIYPIQQEVDHPVELWQPAKR